MSMQEEMDSKEMQENEANVQMEEAAVAAASAEEANAPEAEVANAEAAVTEENNVESTETEEPVQKTIDYMKYSEDELVSMANKLVANPSISFVSLKNDIEQIKDAYYTKFNKRVDLIKAQQPEEGEEEAEIELPQDTFKEIYSVFQAKKREEQKKREEEEKANLKVKQGLIEELKELAKTADARQSLQKCREIQARWKATGRVPQGDAETVNKDYNWWIETFYDNLKNANELRDLDFKKNLQEKVILCEKAEQLSKQNDVMGAFKSLQQLHELWKEIGPVAKELRDEIWERFKAATTEINKKHKEYFDMLHAKEEENLVAKTKLCEEIEALEFEGLSSPKEWQEKADFIISKQDAWRKVGFAPKKDNDKIYERFRSACDKFFNARAEFFKKMKEIQTDNLAKKVALCVQAEELKDSEDWKSTTDKLVELQKEWKTIGAVPRKSSDSVWKRFLSACDHFFDRKNKMMKDQRAEQSENLTKKRDVIKRIKELEIDGNDEAYDMLKSLTTEWNEIGFVPIKDKDAIYKEYKAAIDDAFGKLGKSSAFAFEGGRGGRDGGMSERRRIERQIEKMNSEIKTAENNMGFFSKSKNADALLKDTREKISKLKEEKEKLEERLAKLLDALNQD